MPTLRVAAVLAAFSCAVLPAVGVSQTAAPTPPNPGAAPAAPAAPQPEAGQTPPAAAATAASKGDAVVAKVGDYQIHMSDVQEAMAGVPAEYHQLPPQVLFPMVLDQLIDRRAVAQYARKEGLEADPTVKKAMERAAEGALENAAVARVVRPQITDAAIKAKYDATIGNKPGEEEVHARHILVASEDDAKKIIEELKKGGDFAALAKSKSTDPGAAQGGDLGWFKKGDMLPEFSDAAFALKPGEITQTPVKTRYGYHVIKLEERRTAQPPTLDASKDEIRQQLIASAVQAFVTQAKTGLAIEKFNPDGTPQKATDTAIPAPAPGAESTDAPAASSETPAAPAPAPPK